jgi:hypothetical protein
MQIALVSTLVELTFPPDKRMACLRMRGLDFPRKSKAHVRACQSTGVSLTDKEGCAPRLAEQPNDERTESKPMTFSEVIEVRRKTEAVSKYLHERLTGYIETLRPLFVPDRYIGKLAGGKFDVQGSDRALAEIQQKYREFTAKPFDLSLEFDPHWLSLVGSRLDLQRWAYTHHIQTDGETKAVTITSPSRWILTYRSNFTVVQMAEAMGSKERAPIELRRQFVVNALVMQLAVTRNPGLGQLMDGLHYRLQSEVFPGLSKLPLITFSSPLPSFRPSDDLILEATGFSGVPAFIELLDIEAIRGLRDPLREEIDKLIG